VALNWIRVFGLSVLLTALGAANISHARAQVVHEPASASGKGTVGLGLIGAELGFAIPAIIGVDEVWPYIVFPTVGAAGGAIAGYFAIDANNEHVAGVAVLATGLALVLPTVVLTVSALRYDPERDEEASSAGNGDTSVDIGTEGYEYEDDIDTQPGESTTPPSNRPPSPAAEPTEAAPAAPAAETPSGEPEARRRARPSRRATSPSLANTGLFRLSETGLALGMPLVKAVPTYSTEELRQVGLSIRDQRTELHVSVFSAEF
jgi:hypothetical protein